MIDRLRDDWQLRDRRLIAAKQSPVDCSLFARVNMKRINKPRPSGSSPIIAPIIVHQSTRILSHQLRTVTKYPSYALCASWATVREDKANGPVRVGAIGADLKI